MFFVRLAASLYCGKRVSVKPLNPLNMENFNVIRFFDIIFSLLGLIVGSLILLTLYIIGSFDTGSPPFSAATCRPEQNNLLLW